MPIEEEQSQRKRSKRHRRNRNNISDKARVESVIEFGKYSRQVHKDYQARFKPVEKSSI